MCDAIDCGTGATCADVAAPGTGYTCSCDDGYTGTATTDGAATCTGELIHMIVSDSVTCMILNPTLPMSSACRRPMRSCRELHRWRGVPQSARG
jgi:hypothetical protein